MTPPVADDAFANDFHRGWFPLGRASANMVRARLAGVQTEHKIGNMTKMIVYRQLAAQNQATSRARLKSPDPDQAESPDAED